MTRVGNVALVLGIGAGVALGIVGAKRIYVALRWKLYCEIQRVMQAEAYRKRPQRIILVRHGESMGQVDPTNYETIPDSRIPVCLSCRVLM